MHYFCLFLFCNHLEEEHKACCSALIVLQMYCYYKCSVVHPQGAVGWSAECDCGTSCAYSLTSYCQNWTKTHSIVALEGLEEYS